jgi:hypothetical protein
MWLIRKTGLKARADIWDGSDSACRMYSTGGIRNKSRYAVREERGDHAVCYMRQSVSGVTAGRSATSHAS